MIKTVNYTKDQQLSPHFALHEFRCKDGSKTVKYSDETISLLEKIFDTCENVGKAIITSGYRTPDYSVKVGGTKDDAHTVGIAVDIRWYDKNNVVLSPKYIACIAADVGFSGIGIMKDSIHLDTRTTDNFYNGKWWGDETKNYSLSANGKDFYGYYGLSREEVDKVMGRATKPIVENPQEATKIEKPQPSVTESQPIVTESKPEPNDVIEVPAKTEENAKTSQGSILEALRTLFRLILEWIKGE